MKPYSQSSTNNACQHLSIANSKIGEIMICPECGVVYLSLQSISLRLELEAFAELAKMVKQAKATIEQAQKFSSDPTSQPKQADGLPSTNPLAHEALMQENTYAYYPHKVH